ncbi:MAG: hypothetical protein Q4C80_04945 [Bacillota bacterium]|nr:hypothetical protein [Bacillota bacterium]
MYTCKGCGGYLRFDIESQQLKCDSCETLSPVPDEADQNMEAEYTAKIYTCPSCGGELMGDDNEAVVFCSFCGSSNVLTERYEKESRPAKIIPFKITKDHCKRIYADKLKSSPFAPKELKKPEFIDSFRGIYMPFYLYDAHVNNNISIEGEKEDESGVKKIITEYEFTGNVKSSYEGIPHDASSSFADDISESIVPYEDEQAVDFATGYMSGFYGDTADVDKDIYAEEIKTIAREDTVKKVEEARAVKGITLKSSVDDQIVPEVNDGVIGMYPVWFLSYRNKDRVAYAAINGQTGKMALDIPVDVKKYFMFTLLMAIPLFLALNFLLTLSPSIMMVISGVFALISLIIAGVTQSNLSDALSGANDKGLGNQRQGQKKKTVKPFMVIMVIAIIAVVATFILKPVSDIPYYLVSLICIVAVALTMTSLVKVYNVISTRPLPQFKRSGGDDNA